MAPLVFGENPFVLFREIIDWHNFYMVGLSTLCYRLYYGMDIDKMVISKKYSSLLRRFFGRQNGYL